MKKLLLSLLLAFGLLGCRRDSPAQKLLEGAPAGTTISVLPVSAVQAFHFIEKHALYTVVAVTKRTTLTNVSYNDVTSIGGSQYRFTSSDPHYGSATYTFAYYDGKDGTGGILDPIAVQTTTATVKSIRIDGTSTGVPFNGSGTFILTLVTLGDVNSDLYMTGTYTLTGTTYTVTCTISSPGGLASFVGLSGGVIELTGSGPGGAVGGTLTVNTSHEYNGDISWDGKSGGLHLKENASALLIYNNERFFFE